MSAVIDWIENWRFLSGVVAGVAVVYVLTMVTALIGAVMDRCKGRTCGRHWRE
jgi:hypothetical protein